MMTTMPKLSHPSPPVQHALLRCIVCQRPFDFAAGETGTVLRHIAYGYDFAHVGTCLAAALEWIFVEPGYDRPAFSVGRQRVRVLGTAPADGWAAVLPNTPEQRLAGVPVSFEALHCWALVEHGDGSRRVEGIVRDPEWADEPGGAEFPEARPTEQASIDYALEGERLAQTRRPQWATLIQVRCRAEQPELRRTA
jgi:hypothetical protein